MGWTSSPITTNPVASEGIIKAPLNDPHVTATLCLQRKDREIKCAEQRKRAQWPAYMRARERALFFVQWVSASGRSLSLALSESTSQCYVNNVKWISRPPKRLFVWQHAESFSKALNGRPNWCVAMPLREQQDVAAARAYFSVGHVTTSLSWQLLIPRACFLASCIWPYGIAASHWRMLVSSVGRRIGVREENACKKKKKNIFTDLILCDTKSL